MIAEVRGVIGKLRDSHHRIAQMMAMGWTDSQIKRATGITSHRLALYRNDPVMQDVVAKYSKAADEDLKDFNDFFNELMLSNRVRGELLIADAFEEAMEGERDISLTVIDRIVQGRADRTGYGKTTKIEHKHDFATRLDSAIQRSEKVIEGQVSHASSLPSVVTPLAPPGPPARDADVSGMRTAPEPPSRILSIPFQRRG